MNEIWGVLRGNSIINNHIRAWLLLIVDAEFEEEGNWNFGFYAFWRTLLCKPPPDSFSFYLWGCGSVTWRSYSPLVSRLFCFSTVWIHRPHLLKTFPVSLDLGCWVGVWNGPSWISREYPTSTSPTRYTQRTFKSQNSLGIFVRV